jgi:hypothetical protein
MDADKTVTPTFRPRLTVNTVSQSRSYSYDCGTVFLPKTCFAVNYGTGSVTSSPAGLSCGAGNGTTTTCAATFDDGSVITLTANPVGGSTFQGWYGPCTPTGPLTCTVTMSDSRQVWATFGPA